MIAKEWLPCVYPCLMDSIFSYDKPVAAPTGRTTSGRRTARPSQSPEDDNDTGYCSRGSSDGHPRGLFVNIPLCKWSFG